MNFEKILTEIEVLVSRSSGAGGQFVNRTNSHVQVRFDIPQSEAFNDEQKTILYDKLKNKLTVNGELLVDCEVHRDQIRNKKEAIEKLKAILEQAFFKPKPRKKTKPKRSSIEKRLKSKTQRSQIKKDRTTKWD